MPIDTDHWNQYLAQLIQTKHPLVKNISRVINPKLKAFHDDVSTIKNDPYQSLNFTKGVQTNLIRDCWYVIEQQTNLLNVDQKRSWQNIVHQLKNDPDTNMRLLKAIHDLLNFNEKHYRPIKMGQYRQQYQIDRTPIPISDATQSLGIFGFQTESILGVLNLIENKLIKLIQTNFYS